MTPGARRFLVLGWDGATFDLLDPRMAAGEIPTEMCGPSFAPSVATADA
ncbi:MAG TPA: hypothetical protein VIZ68_05180 [Thermoplasmata archaeon]